MPGLGWVPKIALEAEAKLMASGIYCTVAAPTAPRPKACSLTGYRLNYYPQGMAGTCWVHSPKMLAEMMAKRLGYEAYAICRMLIGYFAKQTYEGGGNPTEGGSPTNAIRAMTKAGIGIAHEELDPYSDKAQDLARRPPPEVWEDASDTFLVAPVVVKGIEQSKNLIASGRGVCTGIPWPGNWENGVTFHDTIGQIVGGHSELFCGYIEPGVIDRYGWLEMENWRELPYPPLPPSVARQVEGYEPARPNRTNSHWIRQDVYVQNCKNQVTEHISATDVTGIHSGVVDAPPSFHDGSWF